MKDTLPSSEMDFAADEIFATYGDKVRVNRKSLIKFGRFDSLGTTETEITNVGATETYLTTNGIDKISSSDAADTQTIRIEGMSISNGVITFVAQTAVLDGQNKVTLDTPLYRATRITNNSSGATAGDVYVYEDTAIVAGVPSDSSKIHAKMEQTDQSTLKACTSVVSSNYFVMSSLHATVGKKTSAVVDLRFRTSSGNGAHFKTSFVKSLSDGFPLDLDFHPYLIIPPGSDISVTGVASTTNVDVAAFFTGYFADIV